jgi:hypothetical protein
MSKSPVNEINGRRFKMVSPVSSKAKHALDVRLSTAARKEAERGDTATSYIESLATLGAAFGRSQRADIGTRQLWATDIIASMAGRNSEEGRKLGFLEARDVTQANAVSAAYPDTYTVAAALDLAVKVRTTKGTRRPKEVKLLMEAVRQRFNRICIEFKIENPIQQGSGAKGRKPRMSNANAKDKVSVDAGTPLSPAEAEAAIPFPTFKSERDLYIHLGVIALELDNGFANNTGLLVKGAPLLKSFIETFKGLAKEALATPAETPVIGKAQTAKPRKSRGK